MTGLEGYSHLVYPTDYGIIFNPKHLFHAYLHYKDDICIEMWIGHFTAKPKMKYELSEISTNIYLFDLLKFLNLK